MTDSLRIIGGQGWEAAAKSEISRKIDGNQTHLKLQPYTPADSRAWKFEFGFDKGVDFLDQKLGLCLYQRSGKALGHIPQSIT